MNDMIPEDLMKMLLTMVVTNSSSAYITLIDTTAFHVKVRLAFNSSDNQALAYKFVIRAQDTEALLKKHPTAYESEVHKGCYSLINKVPESIVISVGGLRKHVERLFTGYTIDVEALETMIKDSCSKMNVTLL